MVIHFHHAFIALGTVVGPRLFYYKALGTLKNLVNVVDEELFVLGLDFLLRHSLTLLQNVHVIMILVEFIVLNHQIVLVTLFLFDILASCIHNFPYIVL